MKKKKNSRNNNSLDYLNVPSLGLDDRAKRSLGLVFLILFGLISLLALFGLAGHFGQFVGRILTLVFGFGRWLVPLIFLYWALMAVRKEKRPLEFKDYLGLVLLFISYQTLFHFFYSQPSWKDLVATGNGGGYIGYYLSRGFYYVFGFWGGVLVLFSLLLVSLVLVFNTSLSRLIGQESPAASLFRSLAEFFRLLFSSDKPKAGAEDARRYVEEARNEVLEAWKKRDVQTAEEPPVPEEKKAAVAAEEKISPARAHDSGKSLKEQARFSWPKRSIKIDLPLELLNDKFTKAIGGDTEANAAKIHRTLEEFGIEVEMGETKVGPTVTQYTFRPADGVKLSRITTLSNDLSLALAAHPIRIEAPIPGQSLVGIEVPNKAKAVVGLREVLESQSFKARKNNLYVALGKDVAGTAWLYDLTKMPHLLVAGATNSGKSVCLNAMIVSLLYQNNPEDLRFIMVDPKRVELPTYNGIPHLLTPVITDVNKTINALKWCLNEMERRYDLLNKAGKRNIQSYNQGASEKLPYIVFIIDELADFMMTAGKDMEAAIIRLAQMSRAIGIHLILATQRPSVDVITGLIKANIPSRIAFSVASVVDSKTILDASGAEKLLGQGDMLFATAEFSKPKRIQGAYLSDDEINDVVNYIKEKSGEAEYLEGVTDRQKVGGNAGVGLDGNHGDEDELFEAAKEIIVKAGKASTSMLQRRLSIGYGRAAKILDMLEEAGVIGPSNGAKPREVMISREQYEADQEAGAISAMPLHDRGAASAPDSYLEEVNDDTLVFNSPATSMPDAGSGSEPAPEPEAELSLTPEEEETAIQDEDEIIEDIQKDKEQVRKEKKAGREDGGRQPADEDDEMFFSH